MDERFLAAKFQVCFFSNLPVWSPHFQAELFLKVAWEEYIFLKILFYSYDLEWFKKLLCGNEKSPFNKYRKLGFKPTSLPRYVILDKLFNLFELQFP